MNKIIIRLNYFKYVLLKVFGKYNLKFKVQITKN